MKETQKNTEIKGVEWEQYFKKLYSIKKVNTNHEVITRHTNENKEINKPFSIETQECD